MQPRPILVFLKAAIAGGASADLFAAPVMVQGHVNASGTYVTPHASHRLKRRPEAPKPERRAQTDLFAAPPPAARAKPAPKAAPPAAPDLFTAPPAAREAPPLTPAAAPPPPPPPAEERPPQDDAPDTNAAADISREDMQAIRAAAEEAMGLDWHKNPRGKAAVAVAVLRTIRARQAVPAGSERAAASAISATMILDAQRAATRELPAAEPAQAEAPPVPYRPKDWGMRAGVKPAERVRANQEAERILAAKPDDADITDEDREALARYTGWGGCGTSPNEYFTPPEVTRAMWTVLGKLGFQGGEVLEPSAGTGVFQQTAPTGARIAAVELSSTSARINRLIHGRRDEVNAGTLEAFAGWDQRKFDAVIGNPPFGDRTFSRYDDLADGKTSLARAEHYFIDTALDKAKDGGLVALIVPNGVMDNPSARDFRARMLAKGQFITAFRLPNTAFKDSHTEVTTDIIILRKRPQAIASALAALAPMQQALLPHWREEVVAGRYMLDGPGAENVMGRTEAGWRAKLGMGNDITVSGSMLDVPETIAAWQPPDAALTDDSPPLSLILDTAGDRRGAVERASRTEPYPRLREGETKVENGVLYVLRDSRWHRAEEPEPEVVAAARKVGALLEPVLDGKAADMTLARAKLIEALDAFTAEHGNPARLRELLDWTSAPQLPTGGKDAAEHGQMVAREARRVSLLLGAVRADGTYSDAVTGAERGPAGSIETLATVLAAKDGAFTPATLAREARVETAEAEDFLHAHAGFARLPGADNWTTMDAYLSGDLWPKHDAALAASRDPELTPADRERMKRQADALMGAIGWTDLGDVNNIQIDSPFVTPECIAAFKKATDTHSRDWTVDDDRGVITVSAPHRYGYGVRDTDDLLARVLMRRGVKKDEAHLVEMMHAGFREWLLGDPDWRQKTEDRYNRTFRGFVPRDYSDAPIEVPGLSPDFSVHAFQWKGVRWAMERGKGIIAADVGVGKTPRALILNQLLRATGRAKKPLIVMPKSLLANWHDMVGMMFPGAKVLTIGETLTKDAEGKVRSREDDEATRRRKLAQLAQEDHDFVLMTLPAWNMLNLDEQRRAQWESEEFFTQRAEALAEAAMAKKKTKAQEKRAAAAKDKFESKQDRARFRHAGEQNITLEATGVDAVIMDEGHCFPAGTLVDGRPIESFRAGDPITAYDHATGRVVTSWVKNLQVKRPASLYRVSFDDGTAIVCTGKHPFFTPDGYVYAADLSSGATCFRALSSVHADPLDMRLLPSADHADQGAGLAPAGEGQDPLLLRAALPERDAALRPGHQGENQHLAEGAPGGVREAGEQGARGAGQLDGAPRGAGEDVGGHEGDRAPAEDARRERPADAGGAAAPSGGAGGGLDGGACDPDAGMAGGAEPLQGGPRAPRHEARGGGGWKVAPIPYPAGPGPEEGGVLARVRVARVEVLERGGDGEYGGLCPGGVVFNVEVAVHHNYFAEGVLVHNSMKNLATPEAGAFRDLKFLGAPNEPSKQAANSYYKFRHIREKAGGGNVFLLTATPTKNSPLEIYSMMQHVAPEVWTDIGIRNADDFISRFVESQNDLILTTDGRVDEANVVTGFRNLDEVRQIARRYIDRTTAAEVGLKLPTPEVKEHQVEADQAQIDAYNLLRPRLEEALKDKNAEGADHPFSIISDMQKVATDMRLYDPSANHPPSPKLRTIADNVAELHKEGGQLVFSEYVASHAMLRDLMVARGMDPKRIGIINAETTPSSAKRQALCDAFNKGELDVLIGNVTMSEGLNAQKRTTDIHHADIPWEPATIIQRNGRGLRQGNKNAGIRLHSYLTKGSFDGYRWQSMMAKGDWQSAFWGTANTTENSLRDSRGSLGRLEMLIFSAADPAEARAKFAAQLDAAKDRREAAQQADAARLWGRYREAKRQLETMREKRKRLGREQPMEPEVKLADRVEGFKAKLDAHPDFPWKDQLDARNVLIDHKTGRVWRPGDEVEVAPGSRFRTWSKEPETFMVTHVDELNGKVSFVAGGELRDMDSKPYATRVADLADLRDGVSPTKIDRDAAAARHQKREAEREAARRAAEARKKQDEADARARERVAKVERMMAGDGYVHPADLRHMGEAWIAEHRDAILPKLREGAERHAIGYHQHHVVQAPDGSVRVIRAADVSKLGPDEHLAMPTSDVREKLIQAEVRNALDGQLEDKHAPARGRNRYGSGEYQGAQRRPVDDRYATESLAMSGLTSLFPEEDGHADSPLRREIAARADAAAAERVRAAGKWWQALDAAKGGFHVTSRHGSYMGMRGRDLQPQTAAALAEAAERLGVAHEDWSSRENSYSAWPRDSGSASAVRRAITGGSAYGKVRDTLARLVRIANDETPATTDDRSAA